MKCAVIVDIDAWECLREEINRDLGKNSIKFDDFEDILKEFDEEVDYGGVATIMDRKKIDGKTRWEVEKIFEVAECSQK